MTRALKYLDRQPLPVLRGQTRESTTHQRRLSQGRAWARSEPWLRDRHPLREQRPMLRAWLRTCRSFSLRVRCAGGSQRGRGSCRERFIKRFPQTHRFSSLCPHVASCSCGHEFRLGLFSLSGKEGKAVLTLLSSFKSDVSQGLSRQGGRFCLIPICTLNSCISRHSPPPSAHCIGLTLSSVVRVQKNRSYFQTSDFNRMLFLLWFLNRE